MLIRRLSAFVAVALLSVPALAAHKTIVISIDGLRGTLLADLENRKLKTPNLVEFTRGGSVADGLIGVFPSVTYPSHTTLVTGVSPDTHGVLGNTLFDPERKTNAAWYWYAEAIKVPTLWDVAKARGLKTAAVSWPVTVGANIDYNFPEYRAAVHEEGLMLYRDLCTPGLAAEFEKATGPIEVGKEGGEEGDELRTRESIFLISTRKPDLMFIHLADMDHQEHSHGPDSAEAYHALENIDALIGKIREAVKKSEPEDDVDFFVVSDHGFFDISQTFRPGAVLNSLGLGAPEGHPDKWRVAAFTHAASFGLVAKDPNDKEAIALATKTFEQIAKDPRYGLGGVFTGSALAATKGYKNSFLAGTAIEGFGVGGQTSGPWVESSGATHGTHGFLPGDAKMDAAFVAFGKGIPAKHIGRHRSIDVAPTVAARQGLTLTNVEGKDILGK